MLNTNEHLPSRQQGKVSPGSAETLGDRQVYGLLVRSMTSPKFLLRITIVGLILRLLLLIFTRHNPPFADETDYQDIAISIIQRHQIILKGWTSAFRPMGEPLVIAAVYAVAGRQLFLVKILQELALSWLPVLCWRMAKTLGFSLQQANLVALLVALNPALAYATATVYPTALTTVLITEGVVVAGTAARLNSLTKATMSAVSLGLAGLFTTTFVPLPAMVSLYFLWKRQLRLAIVFILLGLLPSGLWVLRNRMVLHTWTLATNGGMNLYLGANDEATPRSGNWVLEPPVKGGELARDRVLGTRGRDWILAHRLRWAKLWIARGALVVDSVGKPRTAGVHSSLASRLVGWTLFPFTMAGIVGLFICRKDPEVLFTSAALALIVLSSATTIVKPRFRFPCDPLLTVTAVATFAAAWRGLQRRPR